MLEAHTGRLDTANTRSPTGCWRPERSAARAGARDAAVDEVARHDPSTHSLPLLKLVCCSPSATSRRPRSSASASERAWASGVAGSSVVPITRIGGAPAAVSRPDGRHRRHRPHRAREAVVHDERAHAGRDLHRLAAPARAAASTPATTGPSRQVTAQNDSSTWSSPPSSVRPTKRVGAARATSTRRPRSASASASASPGHAARPRYSCWSTAASKRVWLSVRPSGSLVASGARPAFARKASYAAAGVALVVERARRGGRSSRPGSRRARARTRAPAPSVTARADIDGSTGPSSTNARTRSGCASRVARAEERAVRVPDERQALAPPARSRSCSRSRTASAVDTCASRSPLRVAHCCASDVIAATSARARRVGRRFERLVEDADRGCRGTRSVRSRPPRVDRTPPGRTGRAPPRATTTPRCAGTRPRARRGHRGSTTSVPMRRVGVARPGADHREVERRRRRRRVDRHRRGWRTGTRRRTPSTRATSSAPGPTAPRPPARRASAPPAG